MIETGKERYLPLSHSEARGNIAIFWLVVCENIAILEAMNRFYILHATT
jgi:hypothetical protein